MPQATYREQGCHRAFSVPMGPASPDEGEKVCLMYLYYVFRALCPRPRLENRVVAVLSVPIRNLPARRGGESVFNVSVSCLQSVVPQATSLEQGCRLAFSVPMGPTSQTRGRKCVLNVSVLCLQSAVPQAMYRDQGCRRAFSVPTGRTSQTRGRKCVLNVLMTGTRNNEQQPP